jgi:hypothetical protein
MVENGAGENTFEKIFNFVLMFQTFLFIVFILENINDLTNIEVAMPFDLSGGSVNFFYLVGVVIVLYGVVILASVSIFGAGLNATGSALVGKILGLFVFLTMMMLGTMYYFNQLGWLGLVLQVFFYIVYAFKGVTLMGGGTD